MSAVFFTLLATSTMLLPAVADEPQAQVSSAPSESSITLAHHGAKAPADEYFGQLKLSILGVRNTVFDIDGRADNAAEDLARNLCHRLVLAEDALRDWQSKYPDDAWVPKFGYAMLKDYEKIDEDLITDESHVARDHAIDLAGWLEEAYPNSEFAPK